jgi:hypothetical protein
MAHVTAGSRKFRVSTILISLAIILVLAAVVTYGIFLMNHVVRFGKLASYPNQACVGIGVALRNGVPLKHYSFDAHSNVSPIFERHSDGFLGRHTCTIDMSVVKQTKNKNGTVTTQGYQLGATVQYFNSSAAALNFARDKANPARSWSVDEAGVKKNIPQTSLFTFIATTVPEPYFDSYTVRDAALVRLTMPCAMPASLSKDQNFDNCNKTAQKTLQDFAEVVQQNLREQKLF